MTPLAFDHLCLSCCLRLVWIGDRDKQLALENLLSSPFPHPSLTNQRKLLQLSSASPNDPAFLPAAIPAACSQPLSRFKAKPFFFLPASSCNPIFKGSWNFSSCKVDFHPQSQPNWQPSHHLSCSFRLGCQVGAQKELYNCKQGLEIESFVSCRDFPHTVTSKRISNLQATLLSFAAFYHYTWFMRSCYCVLAASPKIIKLREEASDYSEPARGKNPTINNTLVPVKGINNLGNTCFFNAVMQVGITN